MDYKEHLIYQGISVHDILKKLNDLGRIAVLFLVDSKDVLLGSITDGDIRRGFIKGLSFSSDIMEFIQLNTYKLRSNELTPENFNLLKKKLISIIPLVDTDGKVIGVINIDEYKCLLPLHAVVMAGGEGVRLRPLTLATPKPLLMIGSKPIIEHNIDRLGNFGILDITISLRYLGKQIENYLGNGSSKNLNIGYVWENEPLGTLGALALVEKYNHNDILIMNSDLLTNIDFHDFYAEFIRQGADMSVATVPYRVNIPYGVIETEENQITSIQEKPTYTYYSNAGIYLIKKQFLDLIVRGDRMDATDLIEMLVGKGLKIVNYPILSYWLDIGRYEDFQKAQEDIKHIKL